MELTLGAPAFLTLRDALVAIPLVWVMYMVYWLFLYRFLSPLRDLRGPPPDSVFTGSTLNIELSKAHVERIHLPLVEKYGQVIKYQVMYGGERLFITDPVALQHILVTNSYNWPKPDEARNHLGRLLGKGLVFVEGDLHKRQKKILTPAFSPSHLKDLVPTFFNFANQLRDKWVNLVDSDYIEKGSFRDLDAKRSYLSTKDTNATEAIVDVNAWFGRLTLDVIGYAGFGYNFGALDDKENELAGAFGKMMTTTTRRPTERRVIFMRFMQALFVKFPFMQFLPIERLRLIRECLSTMESESAKILQAKKAELSESGSQGEKFGRDLISLLLKASVESSDSKNVMTDAELQGQMTTFILAGHETTSTSLTWGTLALARDPSVQDRLRAEILAVRSKARSEGRDELNGDDLRGMEYLDAVCREILRFDAPVSATFRACPAGDLVPLSTPITTRSGKVLTSLPVPPGTNVFISIAAANLSKEVFGEDAGAFRPERWLDGSVGAKNQGLGVYSQMLTFLAGPRSCIGLQFALLELKAILFVLVENFVFLQRDGDGPATERRSNLVTRPLVVGEEDLGQRLPLRLRRVKGV